MKGLAVLVLLLVLPAAQVAAQAPGAEPFQIRVIPDPLPSGAPPLTVGDHFWVTVRVSGPAGHYLLPRSIVQGYAARPEVAVFDSQRRDGLLRLEMASFRPGDIVLPAIDALVTDGRGDTLRVPVVSDTLEVASVLAPGDSLLADIKPLWRTPGLPWWIGLVLAALVLALAALWWRRRRQRPEARPVPRVVGDPYREARQRIEALGEEPATPTGRVAAAAGMGDALRSYLADGWGVAARERTTLELLSALPEPLRRERPGLASVLAIVDLAKFARVAPDPGAVPDLARRALGSLDRIEALRRPPVETPAREAAS
ncbi:MAG: hypothetical protein ACREK5_06625 [Gemmatimonadota bacterium]